MRLLTLEQLLHIHVLVADVMGGGMGLRDIGRLESAVASQTQNIFGKELYPSVIEKAAVIIRSVIADHPFVDGNKRTAMLAGLTLLKINSLHFVAHPGEIEDFAVKVTVDKLDVSAITLWLREHIKG